MRTNLNSPEERATLNLYTALKFNSIFLLNIYI